MPLVQKREAVADEQEIEFAPLAGGRDHLEHRKILAARRGAGMTPAGDVIARPDRIDAEVHLSLLHVRPLSILVFCGRRNHRLSVSAMARSITLRSNPAIRTTTF